MSIKKMKKIKTHTVYKVDGKRVPGVTTILDVLGKSALIYWAWDLGCQGIDYRTYRDTAADIGTLSHYRVECEFLGIESDLSEYSKKQIEMSDNCLLSFYEWRKDKKIEKVENELQLVSQKYKYGGTIDIYCTLDGKKTLIDLKTGKAIYEDYFFQLAAYKELLKENGYIVEQTMILRIGRDESEDFEPRIKNNLDKHFELFKNCLNIYSLKKEIKKL